MTNTTNFQSESTASGDEFERIVNEDLVSKGYTILETNVKISGIGVNVDYIAEKDGVKEYGEDKGGKSGGKKRPGAQRTDNVKKAICNGALLKAKYPDAKYVIYFSAEPKEGNSSDEMIKTGEAAKRLGVDVVNGFTGSSIWHLIYAFPPMDEKMIDDGFEDFSKRWTPIFDAYKSIGVKFALEVHPTEIAFDLYSAERALKALGHREEFGFNFDPSHLIWQGVDPVEFIRAFPDRIYHVHMKDAWWGHGDGTVGVFGGHTDFTDARRFWDFRSVGRGDTDFEEIIVALNDIAYAGPLSVEWEDGRMDRFHGAAESCAFTKDLDFAPSDVIFDSAFDKENQ